MPFLNSIYIWMNIPTYAEYFLPLALTLLGILSVTIPFRARPEREHLKYLAFMGAFWIGYGLTPELHSLWRGQLQRFFTNLTLIGGMWVLANTAVNVALGVALFRKQKMAVPLAGVVFALALIALVLRFQSAIDLYFSRSFWQPVYFLLIHFIASGLAWRYAWIAKKHRLLV